MIAEFKPKKELVFKNKDKADFVYNYEARARARILNIYTSKNINNRNKDIITEFIYSIQTSGVGLATINKYLDKLKNLAIFSKKDFDKVKKEDIQNILENIINKFSTDDNRGDESISMHISVLKMLIKWLTNDENSNLINWIKIKNFSKRANKKKDINKYDNIIKPEEVEQMISAADNPRDKALVGALYYSACRISGLIDLKIQDIIFEDNITWINVFEGKSGFRKVPVTEITKLLQNWLACHIDKDNKNSFLWLQERNITHFKDHKNEDIKYENKHISTRRVTDIVKELASKCGITKKVNCHNWRHSRITHLKLSGLDDDYLKLYAGHSKFSSINQMYKHLGTNELKAAMSKLYGLKPGEDKQKNLLQKCYRCEFMNRNTVSICENCGMALNSVSALNLNKKEVKQVNLNKVMGVLLEDPMFKKVLARYFLDKGMGDYVRELAEEEK